MEEENDEESSSYAGVIASIAQKIADESKKKEQLIVAICGAADLGKSFISNALVERLNSKGSQAGHLTLDSCLMNRIQRNKHGISGYDIASYDVIKANRLLTQFANKGVLNFMPYDHATGQSKGTPKVISNVNVLLFDGVQSMHACFSEHVDLTIFIFTDDYQLQQIRTKANLKKRNMPESQAQINAIEEMAAYKEHLGHYQMNADYHVRLLEKWMYQLS